MELNKKPYFHINVGAFNVEGNNKDDLKFPLNMIYRGSTNRVLGWKQKDQPFDSYSLISFDLKFKMVSNGHMLSWLIGKETVGSIHWHVYFEQ